MEQSAVQTNQDLERLLTRFGYQKVNASDKPLGQLLLDAAFINEDQLNQALRIQEQQKDAGYLRLGELLIQQDMVSRQHIYAQLARKFAIPCVRLVDCQISSQVLARVPAYLVLQYHILPLAILDRQLVVACETPWDNEGLALLRFHTGLQLELVMATRDGISQGLSRYYSRCDEDEALQDNRSVAGQQAIHGVEKQQLEQQANKRPIVRLLNTLLLQGLVRAASDIHIRPTEKAVEVFYRIDGHLQLIRTIDKNLLAALVSRAKIIAHLNIAERRLPQDGHARFQREGYQVDLRLSIIPTIHGESVVIRLLDSLTGIKQLVDLGLPDAQYKSLQALARQKNGLILVVGPTGAGKSTTLYALLNEIRKDGRHILTVEDPVEYHIEGVEQVQLNERKGLGFSNVLRHFLRHDPDVIMVGEIRDHATAELAVRAALTGHLVLSTLHTNDAPSAITRLINMGIEPYLLSSTLLAVMAQGLIRINCSSCLVACRGDDIAQLRQSFNMESGQPLFKGSGCSTCHYSGYKGRHVVSELMLVDEGLVSLINRQLPLPQLRQYAIDHGMQALADQALDLVRQGRSTLEEVLGLHNDIQGMDRSSRQKAETDSDAQVTA